MDCENLIALIEQHPALWDTGHPLFKDRVVKEMAWQDVAARLLEGWDEWSELEKGAQLTEMKSKWRNIRDNFVRSLNPGRNSTGTGCKRKKYVYSNSLGFLKDSLERKKSSGSIDGDSFTPELPLDAPTQSNLPSGSSVQSKFPKFKERPCSSKKASSLTKFQSKLLKSLNPSDNCDDPDKLYLLSLLPFYKSLPEMQKLEFQQNTLNFIIYAKGGVPVTQATPATSQAVSSPALSFPTPHFLAPSSQQGRQPSSASPSRSETSTVSYASD